MPFRIGTKRPPKSCQAQKRLKGEKPAVGARTTFPRERLHVPRACRHPRARRPGSGRLAGLGATRGFIADSWLRLQAGFRASSTITARARGPGSARSTDLASRSSGPARLPATPVRGRTDPDDAVAAAGCAPRRVHRMAMARCPSCSRWRRSVTNDSGDSGRGNLPSRCLIVISHTESALRYTALVGARHAARARNGSRGSSDTSQRNVQVSSRSVTATLRTSGRGGDTGLRCAVLAPAASGCRGRRATA